MISLLWVAWEANSVKEVSWPFAAQKFLHRLLERVSRRKTMRTFLNILFYFSIRLRFLIRNHVLRLDFVIDLWIFFVPVLYSVSG